MRQTLNSTWWKGVNSSSDWTTLPGHLTGTAEPSQRPSPREVSIHPPIGISSSRRCGARPSLMRTGPSGYLTGRDVCRTCGIFICCRTVTTKKPGTMGACVNFQGIASALGEPGNQRTSEDDDSYSHCYMCGKDSRMEKFQWFPWFPVQAHLGCRGRPAGDMALRGVASVLWLTHVN